MRSNIRKFLVILAFMLLAGANAMCTNVLLVHSEETVIQSSLISLHSKNPEENIPFQMTNMFPGDSKTQYYRVSVSYTGTITIHFQAEPGSGDEKLGEVLEVSVCLINSGEVLYDGKLTDMPILGQELSTDGKSQTEELIYEVTIGLSTGVGNEFQNKSLIADLSWWADGTAGSDDPIQPSEPGKEESGESSDQESTEGTGSGSLVNPKTGDGSSILLWMVIMCVTIAVILLILMRCGREKIKQKYGRKLFLSIFMMISLVLGLGITSMALIYQKVTVEDNLFQTGRVSICLNDNQPVFDEGILFEPGMAVKKDFTLRNNSTCDIHYRLWFTNVDGVFADTLLVELMDEEVVLFEGTLADLNGERSKGAHGILREGEEHIMTILFRVPEDCGNGMQGRVALFDLNAEAVQAVNNPSGLFE